MMIKTSQKQVISIW